MNPGGCRPVAFRHPGSTKYWTKSIGVNQSFSGCLNNCTDENVRVVEALAFRVSVAIANAWIYQAAQAELAEFQCAQAAPGVIAIYSFHPSLKDNA